MAAKREWKVTIDLVKAHHFHCEIITPGHEKARVTCPCHADYVLCMQVCVLLVENHRGVNLMSDTWGLKDLNFLGCCHKEESRVG